MPGQGCPAGQVNPDWIAAPHFLAAGCELVSWLLQALNKVTYAEHNAGVTRLYSNTMY